MIKNKLFSILALLALLATTLASGATNSSAADESRTFPETGKTVSGRFLDYWNNHGGLAQQGFPISSEMQEKSDTDGKTYVVQYFERAVFEKHPEKAQPYDVLLSLLGTFNYDQKYNGNAPGQKASTTNPSLFEETGKTIGGVFRTYWETHGGLAQQGFPISDEFEEVDKDGTTRTVQYFQRAVFEYHEELAGTPNEVLLSLLGASFYSSKHSGSVAPPPPGGGPRPPGGAPPPGIAIPAGPVTIVALGDSLTEGEGDQPDGGGFPARLLISVNTLRTDSQMINLGKSGWTSQQMVDEQLPAALEARPQVALVWIGSNDMWFNNGPQDDAADVAKYTRNIDTTLDSLTKAGARIFIALLDDQSKRPYATSPTGASMDPEGVEHMSKLVSAFNNVVRAKATEYGATTVDFYNTTIFSDPATLAEDGGHPNAKGYDIIAQIWFDAIRQVLQ